MKLILAAIHWHVDNSLDELSFDLLFLILIAINVILGYLDGVIHRGIILAAIFGGVAAASRFGLFFASGIDNGHNLNLNAMSFLTTFGVVIILCEILGKLYAAQIERVVAVIIDRPLGALAGGLTGLLEVVVIVLVILAVGKTRPPSASNISDNHAGLVTAVKESTLVGPIAQLESQWSSLFSYVIPKDLPSDLEGN